MSFGTQSSKTTPVDMTPAPFAGLQGPFADVIARLLGSQGGPAGGPGTVYGPTTGTAGVPGTPGTAGVPGAGVGAKPAPGSTFAPINGTPWTVSPTGTQSNPFYHPITNSNQGPNMGDHMDTSNRLQTGVKTLSPTGTAGTPGSPGTPGTPGSSGTNPNDILSGMPYYQGELVAGMAPEEKILLAQLMKQATGAGGTAPSSAAQAMLQKIMGDYNRAPTNPQYQPDGTLAEWNDKFQGASNFGPYKPDGSLADFADMLQGASNTNAFTAGGNPFMDEYIKAAQRPTLEGLTETLTRDLPGRFTQAGQFTQPQGSSAFDRAAAIATRGAANANADIATNISYQAAAAAQDRESGALGSELDRRFQGGENNRSREDADLNKELDRRLEGGEGNRNRSLTELTGNRDRALDAAKALPGVTREEINTTIDSLKAAALPRMIKDLGIERGIEEFNNRVNSFLTTLGITAGVTRPVITSESKSSGMNFGLPSK